jgi:hypothetical protein
MAVDNTDFLNGKTLQQFAPWLWAALDATYYAGGRTTVNGQPGPEPVNVGWA